MTRLKCVTTVYKQAKQKRHAEEENSDTDRGTVKEKSPEVVCVPEKKEKKKKNFSQPGFAKQ